MALRKHREELGAFNTRYFINCWHMNDFESAAMWKLYAHTAGVAIRSTKGRLMKAFDAEGTTVSISPVTYFDFNLDDLMNIPLPADGGLPEHYKLMTTPELCFKRKSFEHERELRIMTWSNENDATDAGIYVPVNLDMLIEKVYVSPVAPNWLAGVVSCEMKQYGLDQEVVHSDLYSRQLT